MGGGLNQEHPPKYTQGPDGLNLRDRMVSFLFNIPLTFLAIVINGWLGV